MGLESLQNFFAVAADDASRLRTGPVLRWGIAGPGRIADSFVQALRAHTNQMVSAIGSRSLERAERFRRIHGVAVAHDSYNKLVDDPGVDIVYVSAPNSAHFDIALLAIQAGKHVLIEKPIGVDATQARELRDKARAAGVFAMEGVWSRFLPQFELIGSILAAGELGEIQMVSADFGESFTADDEPSVFNPHMAGGALRDLGVYPAWFAQFVLGQPSTVFATGSMTESGVDAQSAVTLSYAGGAIAQLSTSLLVATPGTASISGTQGMVVFESPFLMPGGFTISRGTERVTWRDGSGITGLGGLAWEAVAVAECIAQGKLESPEHSLEDSIAVSSVLDECRKQLGAP